MPLTWVAEVCTASAVDQEFAPYQRVHEKTVMHRSILYKQNLSYIWYNYSKCITFPILEKKPLREWHFFIQNQYNPPYMNYESKKPNSMFKLLSEGSW